MSVNMGQAIGYLDLDTSKFKSGFKSALADLKTFQSQTATSKDKLAAFSSAATSTGRSLTKGLTVPIAGIGAAAVAVTAKFDAGMSKVQAISGATSGEMEKLRAKAKEMGAQTKFSATESAEAFNYMAMAGWKTNDMLDGIEGIMNLAAASGEDLATTSDIVTDALTAFGLSAEDSTHFADVLAAASSNANTNVSMMGETFKYVAPVAGALGFNVEDVSTAIGLMANSGIKGSQAGTALRNIFTRMVKPTKESAKVMEDLGISVTDSSGQMKDFDTIMGDLRKGFAGLSEAEKAQAASALAGQYGMSGLLAIVNSSDKDFNKLKDAIYNADGASQEMAETMMDNLPGAITLAKSALEGLGIRIGEVITPAVTKVVRVFTSFISWLSQASDGAVRFAVGMGIILASIGPVLLITGTLTRNVLTLIEAYNMLSKVMAGKTVTGFIKAAAAKAKDAAMTVADTVANLRYQASLQGGMGVISGAISKVLALAAAHKFAAGAALGIVGAVIGLIVYMKRTGTSVDELKDKVMNMFNNLVEQFPQIMETVTRVISSFVAAIPDMFDKIVQQVPQVMSMVVQAAAGIVQQIPSILASALTTIGTIITTGLSNLKTALPEIAKWWANDMPQLISVGSDMLVNIINGFAEALPELINTGSDIMVQMIDEFFAQAPKFIEAGMQIVLALVQGVIAAMPQLVSAMSKILTDNLGPILSQIVNVMMAIANSIITNLPVILQALVTIITALVKAIADNAPTIIAAALKLMISLATGILQALPQIIVAAAKIAAALIQAILAIVGAMIGAGVKILQALWSGIQSWASTLTSKVKGVGKRIMRAIVSGIGNLLSIGRKWIMGLWNGIKSRFSKATSGVRSFARGLPRAVKGAIGSLFSAGSNFIQGLWNGMSSRIGSVISNLRSKLSTVAGLARKIFRLGSPSKLMFQYGVWFMEGLENGIDKAYRPLLKGLRNHMEEIVSVYNPLTDYDFGIGESMDSKILQALGDISTGSGESARVGGNMITQNITVDGAENPEDFAERLARQLKISMRTV